MKIKDLGEHDNIIGKTITNGAKKMIIAHAWPCGENEIGMFLVKPGDANKTTEKLNTLFVTRKAFLNMDIE